MKSKIGVFIFLILIVILMSSFIIINNNNNKLQNNTNNTELKEEIMNDTNDDNIIVEKEEGKETMDTTIKITISNKIYSVKLEENETAQSFISMLPQEFNMSELNGNEKYVYLDNTLPTNSYNPKHIEAGDIMLYGNNCLVLFYKSFDTSYSYTKIGHIDNLSDLGNKDITIKFDK